MKQTGLRRLSPKEFNAERLAELTRQGRVFIAPASNQDNDAYKGEILDYVRRISTYADEAWQEDVEWLWRQIVDATCFRECLTYKYGLQAGHMNRYTVTNIVGRMQGKGVYRRDVTMLTLHLELEGITKRNKYYTSCGNYALTSEAKAMLKDLLKRV